MGKKKVWGFRTLRSDAFLFKRRFFFLISLCFSMGCGRTAWSVNQSNIGSFMGFQEFESILDLKEHRRVGVGFNAAGATGIYGAVVELNFATQDSALVGFGSGNRYSTFTMNWKHMFEGLATVPYITLGFAHWYSGLKYGALQKTNPDFLGQKFLSEEEKITGVFIKDFFVPAAGLQFNQLFGRYVGTSIYAEIDLLIEMGKFEVAPTGAIGLLYYF